MEGKSSVVRELVRTLLDGDDDLTCKDLVEEGRLKVTGKLLSYFKRVTTL